MPSRSSQTDEPAVSRPAFKAFLLRIPARLSGEQEYLRAVPDVARRQMRPEQLLEAARRVVLLLPLFCLLPWGHALKLDAVKQRDVRGAGFGAAVIWCIRFAGFGIRV